MYSLAARSPARVMVVHPACGPSAIQPCPCAYARADASFVPRNAAFRAMSSTQVFTISVLEFAPAATKAFRRRMALARSKEKTAKLALPKSERREQASQMPQERRAVTSSSAAELPVAHVFGARRQRLLELRVCRTRRKPCPEIRTRSLRLTS